MAKIDARLERNAASLLALRDLLRLITRKPAEFASNETILKALKSQGAMASLEFEFEDADGIKIKTPLSLNTVKTHANQVLERGFGGLNALRASALDAINSFNERSKSSNKRTKSGLAKRTEELEEEIYHHRRVNMILLQGLSLAMGELKSIRDAPDSKIREKRAKEALRTLAALVSINPPPFDLIPPFPTDATVTKMDSYRK